MSLINTNEMFINMKSYPRKRDSAEFDAFWDEEKRKCDIGVTINGVYINGWLYWHLNHWAIDITQPDKSILTTKPGLRDNDWIIAEGLNQATLDNKALLVIGLRQLGKTTIAASMAGRAGTLYKKSQNIIVGASDADLGSIVLSLDNGLLNCTPQLRVPRITRDWTSNEVYLGKKKTSGDNEIHSVFRIRNTQMGRKTEAVAGATNIKSFFMDEVGKGPWLQVYEAAKPAIKSAFGWRCVPILTGCVCAGTKVWTNDGNLINIEDLKPELGIIGYNGNKYSKENITYWQPPHKKDCYRITTNTGRSLECSDDHPILYRSRNESEGPRTNRTRKVYFKETKTLIVGDQIAILEELPLFSNKEMWEPRLVGWLIGDGSYGHDKTPRLTNCDIELNNYIECNFDTKLERDYITKEGKHYKETRIKGICKNLKSIGIYGQTKLNKTLPVNIHSYSLNSITEIIGGLFDTDGCAYIDSKNAFIKISSASENLLLEVQLLLQKLGIHGNIFFKKPNLKNKKDKNGYYDLQISDRKSLLSFYKYINFKINYKQEILEKIVKTLLPRKNKIPKESLGLRFERLVSIEYIGKKPVYNLTAGTTNTYVANGIVTHNTGGSFEKGKEAEIAFFSPDSNDILAYVNEHNRKTGLFMPGWYKQDSKVESKLSTYLGIEEGSELDIPMLIADKELAMKQISEERLKKEQNPDQSVYLKEIMYHPLNEEECFLSENANIFPKEMLMLQKKKLLELGDSAKPTCVELYQDGEGVKHKFTTKKPILNYPATPGEKESVIQIWEFPMSDAFNFYVAGTDPYKQGQAKYSDSVGSTYIYKRTYDVLSDKWQDMVVACYSGRPKTLTEWYTTTAMLLEFYNCKTLCENEDIGFIQHFVDKNLGYKYFVTQPAWIKDIVPNSTVERDYGIHATTKLIGHFNSCIHEYITEVIGTKTLEDGTTKPIFGVSRILDPMLLEELLRYDGKMNADRVRAFGITLAYAKSMTKLGPVNTQKEDNRFKELNKMQKSGAPNPMKSPFLRQIR